MGESNALFMPKAMWQELGGLDEQFVLPGGGLSNHDLYRRACELDGAQLVVLLGEGTFHQIHGGAATSGRFGWREMHDEYVALRGSRLPTAHERAGVRRPCSGRGLRARSPSRCASRWMRGGRSGPTG